jgi:hypothetical protein
MPNNIAVSITADVADLQVKRAIMSAELKAAQKDLNDFAKSAKTSGMTDELRTSMLGAADAVAKARNQIGQTDRELQKLGVGMASAHSGTAGVTRELVVMAREASRGNFSRMSGSAMILADRMGVLTKVINPVSLAILGTIGAVGAAVVASAVYEAEQQKLIATLVGVGAASGLSAAQMQAAANAAAQASGQARSTTLSSAEAFAAAGVRSQDAIQKLSADVAMYAALTGDKAPAAQKALADAMRDPAKGAQTLHDQIGILDGATLEHIRTLTAAGEKDQAVAILVEALAKRFDEASAAGVRANGGFAEMGAHLKDLIDGFGKLTQQIGLYSAEAANAGVVDAVDQQRKSQGSAVSRAQHEAQLNEASAAGLSAYDKTPEGQDQARLQALQDSLSKAGEALKADAELHGAHSDAAKRDAAAVAEYKRAVDTFLPSAEKAHQLAQLDAQLAQAREGHDQARISNLTRQRALVDSAGQVMSPDQAAQKANDAAALAADKTHAPKGPGIVEQWQEEYRKAQVASQDFFGDEAQQELDFWSKKVALTTRGSKDWLDVQGHIYEASKALARQNYQDQLATLNDQLEADRDNWAKEQKDWNDKLAFIASKFGEQSSEYKNAYRELEAAEREHQRQMAQIARSGAQEKFDALKTQVGANRSVREADANTAISGIQQNARYSPVGGEIQAAQQIAAIHQQLQAQEMADEQALHAAKVSMAEQEMALAGNDLAKYQQAVRAKTAADEEWAAQQKVLSDKAANQQIADQQRVAQAWHSVVDPMVSTVGSQFKGLIEGTESWQQALVRLGEGALDVVIAGIERVVEAHLAGELQKTAATVAGTTARTSAETAEHAPFLARIALELAHWLGFETAKTASTAAGATSRAAAEGAATAASIAAAKAQAGAEIPAYTGIAAMEAAASVAMVPFAGPGLAAAAAGEMVALGASQMALASFAVGTNMVPNDMIAQIHAGERIIPAADNRALMAAVGAGPGAGGGGGGGRGDVHFHTNYAPQLMGEGKSFRQQLQGHQSDLEAMMRKIFISLFRNGAVRG